MVTTFLFDLLPLWLARLGRYAQQSCLYRWLSALYHWAEGLVRASFCGRLWLGSGKLREAADTSLFGFCGDAVIRWMTEFAGKIAGWLVRPICQSRIGTTLCKLPRYNFAWFYGLVFLVCYCIPGEYWRNQYALLLSVVLFAAMLLDAWYQDRLPFRVKDLGFWFFGFLFACVLAIAAGTDRSESVRVFCFYLTAFLLCMSLVGTVTNRGRLMSVLGFFYVTLVLTGVVAFVQRIQGVEVNASLTDLSMNAGMPGRVYSTLENPNNYAEFIVLMFPISLVFCTNIVDRRWKTLSIAALAIPVGALLMTYSRSGWVSFALAAVVFLALTDKRLLPLIPVAVVLAVPLLPDTIFNRILTIGNTDDSSNMYRIYIWGSVLEMLKDYGLAGIGLGPGNFEPLYKLYCDPNATIAPHSHMLYLEVWLEMGLVGIVSFLCLYLGVIRRGIRAIKKSDPLLRQVLIACVSSLVGVSFVAAAEYIWFYPRVMFAFFILIGVTLSALKLAEEANDAEVRTL